MDYASVLMCFNVPRNVKDQHLYELFSVAGPIEDIHFGKTGRSVFIIYESEEAVITAKEVLKDVKLYGRPIRMFDRNDIETIHSKQQTEVDLKRKHEYDADPPPKRPYNEFASRHNHYYGDFSQSRMGGCVPNNQFRGEFMSELVLPAPMHSAETRTDPYDSEKPHVRNFHRSDLIPDTRNYGNNVNAFGSVATPSRDINNSSADIFSNPYSNERYSTGGYSPSHAWKNGSEQAFKANNAYKPESRFHNRDNPIRCHQDRRENGEFRSRKSDKPYDKRSHHYDYRGRDNPPADQLRNQHRHQKYRNFSSTHKRFDS